MGVKASRPRPRPHAEPAAALVAFAGAKLEAEPAPRKPTRQEVSRSRSENAAKRWRKAREARQMAAPLVATEPAIAEIDLLDLDAEPVEPPADYAESIARSAFANAGRRNRQ